MRKISHKTIQLSLCLAIALFFNLQFMQAAITTGTIGNGTFVDWENNESQAFGLDFNNDGYLEFVITATGFDVEYTNCYLQFTWTDNGNNIWTQGNMDTEGWDEVLALTENSSIGSNGNWEAQGDAFLVSMFEGTPFLPLNTDSYIGFRIKIGSNYHYGWAKVQLTGDATNGYTANWISCAYENTPQTAILAGDAGVGISTVQNNSITAYPNPVVDIVTINMDKNTQNPIPYIYNVSGKLVNADYSVNDATLTINMQNLSSGLYFIKIQGLFEEQTIRIIKQ